MVYLLSKLEDECGRRWPQDVRGEHPANDEPYLCAHVVVASAHTSPHNLFDVVDVEE